MIKNAKRFFVLFGAIVLLAVGSIAQVRQATPVDLARAKAELMNTLETARDTAVFENGKLRSFRIKSPKGDERFITIEHGKDDRSFTMVDGSLRISVFLDEDRRLSS